MGKLDQFKGAAGAQIGASFGTGGGGPNANANPAPPGMDLAHAVTVPARLRGTAKAKDALVIPVDKIRRDESQPREEFDEDSLARLADSLRKRGQLQPIRVRWDESLELYVIIAGERRWRAAILAGLANVSCVVHDGPVGPADVLALQLVENALREDLKPIEQAKAYRRLMETHGWSGNQLARELAVSAAAVSQVMALLRLPEQVQTRVEEGTLAPRLAYEISKLPDPRAQAELAEQAAGARLNLETVAEVVKARKRGGPGSSAPAEPLARVEVKFDDGGKIVVTLPPGTTGAAAALDMLQRGVKKLRASIRQTTPGEAA